MQSEKDTSSGTERRTLWFYLKYALVIALALYGIAIGIGRFNHVNVLELTVNWLWSLVVGLST